MEDIMRMNDILRPYQEKQKSTQSDNVADQCIEIEVDFVNYNFLLRQI